METKKISGIRVLPKMAFKLGCIPWNKGNKISYKHNCKKCNKIFHNGKKVSIFCSHSCARVGKKMTQENKDSISKKNIGKNNGMYRKTSWNYIDGRSKFLGPDRYGDDWNKIRLTVYKRDDYKCQECGITMSETKKAHHVHHIKPFLDSGDNSLKNLITLCPSCHRKIEAKLMRERKAMEVFR